MANFKPEYWTELEPSGPKATAALIFLHGASETGTDVAEMFKSYMKSSGHEYIKCYFPTAALRYLSIRGAYQRIWFDTSRTGGRIEDVLCNLKDADAVTAMLERKITEIVASGIPRSRIALGGHSQGGMVGLYAVYAKGVDVGAFVGISTGYSFYKQVTISHGFSIPLLTICGMKDAVLTPVTMEKLWYFYRSCNIKTTIKKHVDHAHEMNEDYVKDLIQWLESMIPTIN